MIARSLLMAATLCACAGAVFSGAADAQTYVYDTRAMVSDGSWTTSQLAFIGGSASQGQAGVPHDAQIADDFTLSTRTRLTRVTLDMIEANSGTGGPSGGFLVEVFANLADNRPSEEPTVSRLVPISSATFVGMFSNSTPPSSTPGDRVTWNVDLTSSDVVLDPGTWWLSVTPKNDGDPFGSSYRAIGSFSSDGVAVTYRRCGGLDHGNDYPCAGSISSTNSIPDWRVNMPTSFLIVTISRRIEGEEVHQVQGACCTGTACSIAAGAGACAGGTYHGDNTLCGTPSNPTTCCPANYNGTNGVSVQDIFDFLSGWFSAAPAADFNQVNGITVQDIFDFLAAWFSGC